MSVILEAKTLNLPEPFAVIFHGKKVELIQTGEDVIIRPIECPIEKAYGMFEGSGITKEILHQRRAERELEYDGE
ncbi:MAG: hypothetical protein FWC67_02735 [Defluviitaleaceae bacterium]|nr:hypothetical protein [Defluviitaleaceae bacterium]